MCGSQNLSCFPSASPHPPETDALGVGWRPELVICKLGILYIILTQLFNENGRDMPPMYHVVPGEAKSFHRK